MQPITQYLVLSQGRSGSVLLAEKLGRAQNVLPNYVKHTDDLADATVQHSHLVFEREDLQNYQLIFNLRHNPIDTLMSGIMINHYRIFHKFSNQQFDFEPFEFSEWNRLPTMIKNYIDWHVNYSKKLRSQDVVVFYEDMIKQINDINKTYQPLYVNKQALILNYDQVLIHFKQHEKSLLESQQAFVEHKNPIDIYAVIN